MRIEGYQCPPGPSLSERAPSHSQSASFCCIVTSLTGAISSSLQAMNESDIIPKSASVKSLVLILIKF